MSHKALHIDIGNCVKMFASACIFWFGFAFAELCKMVTKYSIHLCSMTSTFKVKGSSLHVISGSNGGFLFTSGQLGTYVQNISNTV